MIDKITAFNITQEFFNQTKFQQISEISQEPYFMWGHAIVIGIPLLMWFAFSFARISKSSNKLCWQSWINTRSLMYLLVVILLYVLIFIFPLPTYWA